MYKYYPSGMLEALSKLGGLLAILKISAIINCLHRKCFRKEINKNDEEGGLKYSIENFNRIMERLEKLEE